MAPVLLQEAIEQVYAANQFAMTDTQLNQPKSAYTRGYDGDTVCQQTMATTRLVLVWLQCSC